MKVLIDMNLSPVWVPVLSNAGIEATHWSRIGDGCAPDSEIMAYAKHSNSVILTQDLDFSAILAITRGEKPSVVQIRGGDSTPDAIAFFLIAALREMSDALDAGALLTIDADRTRLRLLPLR